MQHIGAQLAALEAIFSIQHAACSSQKRATKICTPSHRTQHGTDGRSAAK